MSPFNKSVAQKRVQSIIDVLLRYHFSAIVQKSDKLCSSEKLFVFHSVSTFFSVFRSIRTHDAIASCLITNSRKFFSMEVSPPYSKLFLNSNVFFKENEQNNKITSADIKIGSNYNHMHPIYDMSIPGKYDKIISFLYQIKNSIDY